MLDTEYRAAYQQAFEAACAKLQTLEDLDDAVFPDAFSNALRHFPHTEAEELNVAVHDGIAAAYFGAVEGY